MLPLLEVVAGQLLEHVDPDPERAGLRETPFRVANYWREATRGYATAESTILKVFEDGADGADEMVFQGAIPFFSNCEHHMVPFFGVVHVAYIPRGKILGLSKFARLIEVFARRLQVQERMTAQIADALATVSPDVGVCVRARHLCMESRGVQKIGTITYTSALRGALKEEAAARAEFLQFVQMADARTTNL